MAQSHQTEVPKRKRKGASIVVWGLMAMLVLGLGGFGVQSYGTGITAIGSVGDREIGVNDYARALQQEIAAFGAQVGQQIGLPEAQSLGLDQRVRQQLVVTAALDNEADRVGLSVGDTRVAEEITRMSAFKGPDGNFDREAYKFTLERNNVTEAKFETDLRADLSRQLMQGAVVGGFVAPPVLTDTLYTYIGERRGLTVLRLMEKDLTTALPAPTDADLQAHYDANIAAFTAPEAKRITYAVLLPESLATKMPVDDVALKTLYDERLAEFVQPERRLVERLVFPSDADAAAAKAKLDAGTPFEDLVKERGLSLGDIDLGDLGKDELGAAADAVFALTEPGVVGPLQSDLGPALFRMNAVLAAQETTFDEAREGLMVEYQQDAARRAISDKVEAIDDALASGATLEDLVKDFEMALGTIDFSDKSDEPIAGYPAFRDAATAIKTEDFPEAILLDDGGVVAMRLDETVAAAPIPFDQARADVEIAWHAATLSKALADRATTIKSEVEAGASLAAYGILSVTPEMSREGLIEATPQDFLTTVFGMAENEIRVIQSPEMTGLVRLDRIAPAAAEGESAAALKAAIAAQAEQAVAQDAFALFTSALTAQAGITLDQTAIDAVHAQYR